jgi:hypothetical protein
VNVALCPRALALVTSAQMSRGDGAGADVLEIGPDQPTLGAQHIRHRGVAMKRLSGQWALEHRWCQCVQVETKPVDVLPRQRGRWTQLGEQALQPVPNLAHRGQVSREAGERRVQFAQRTAELPWLRRRSLRVVCDELPHRHPQPVLLVRRWRQDVAGRNDQVGPVGQEGADGYVAREPLLGVVVQDRPCGHHPRHDRRGLQMHQDVAARRNPTAWSQATPCPRATAFAAASAEASRVLSAVTAAATPRGVARHEHRAVGRWLTASGIYPAPRSRNVRR